MAAAKSKSPLVGSLIAVAVLAVPLLGAPPVIRGFAALAWVHHYESREDLPRPRRTAARDLVDRADVAMRNLAPLPQASEAAFKALKIGERTEHQEGDREAALMIYRGIVEACRDLRNRPLSGAGFAVIEARAVALEEAARRAASQ